MTLAAPGSLAASAPTRTGAEVGRSGLPPLVSVVVVNYNGRDLLAPCLESIQQQLYSPYEIIVVDNGSTDGSVEWVQQNYPAIRLISLDHNRGFAGGCNAGIAAASGELIATLNNDAQAEPDWLGAMVRAIQGRPDVGMIASKMLFTHAPDQINAAGIALDRLGIAWDRDGGAPDRPVDAPAEVFGPCAGAALYRRTLFDDVGAFDDDFFMYFEDVDLAWRARSAGWRCVYAPEARVYHQHSASAGAASPFKRYHLGRNKVWLLVKNYPAPYLWLYLALIVGYDLAAILPALVRTKSSDHSASADRARIRGRLDALRSLGRFLGKRSTIQHARRVPAWRVLAEMQPIPWPWQVARRFAHLDDGVGRGVRSPGCCQELPD